MSLPISHSITSGISPHSSSTSTSTVDVAESSGDSVSAAAWSQYVQIADFCLVPSRRIRIVFINVSRVTNDSM